jgi:hypothetical protein
MRGTTRIAAGVLGLTLAIATGPTPGGRSADVEVAFRPVKYADLCKTVRGLKGKVVVVDFWAEF